MASRAQHDQNKTKTLVRTPNLWFLIFERAQHVEALKRAANRPYRQGEMQNTSHAVMSQRSEARDSLDDFPTPPWATRALVEHVIERGNSVRDMSVLEPACGRGHMARALSEYFGAVEASDIQSYGYGKTADFLTNIYAAESFDWVITNPPFKSAEDFVHRALPVAKRGVAVLVRTVFIESVGRYQRIFSQFPPTIFAQFTERVPMVKGRIDRTASTATGYAWVVWEKTNSSRPVLAWVPPCRKTLERAEDYSIEFLTGTKEQLLEPRQVELFG